LVVVGLPIIQLIAELLFFFWFDYEDTLIIKVLQSSFRLTFQQEYEYDEVRLQKKI